MLSYVQLSRASPVPTQFDNAGAMMSVDDTLMCSFQILKPAEKRNCTTPAGTGTVSPSCGGAAYPGGPGSSPDGVVSPPAKKAKP